MIRTIIFDDSTHKIVPIEPTDEMIFSGNLRSPCQEDAILTYQAMIESAPEYQDVSLLIQFAWFIPACGMFARSKEECDKWIAAGHKVIPLHVIPESYQAPTKDE